MHQKHLAEITKIIAENQAKWAESFEKALNPAPPAYATSPSVTGWIGEDEEDLRHLGKTGAIPMSKVEKLLDNIGIDPTDVDLEAL